MMRKVRRFINLQMKLLIFSLLIVPGKPNASHLTPYNIQLQLQSYFKDSLVSHPNTLRRSPTSSTPRRTHRTPQESFSFSMGEDFKQDQSFGFMSSEEASDAACRTLPGLSQHQRGLCLRNPGLVWAMVDGTQLGLYECVHQFRMEKWNCSAAKVIYFVQGGEGVRGMSESSPIINKISVQLSKISQYGATPNNLVSGLQGILKKGSRETAFLSAAWAAGGVQAITRACSRGRISTCDCDPLRRDGKSKDSEGDFTWGGCSDPIRFGMRLTRLFLDSADMTLSESMSKKERDLHYRVRRVRGSNTHNIGGVHRINRKTRNATLDGDEMSLSSMKQIQLELNNARTKKARVLMDLHNRKAGRRLVWQNREKKCKCHGVSGACSLRTCWQRVSQFRQVGNLLKIAYHNAIFSKYEGNNGKLIRSIEPVADVMNGNSNTWKNNNKQKKNKQKQQNPLNWLVVNPGVSRWKMRSRRSDNEEQLQFRERSLRHFKDTLVYLEGSPDYCNVDTSIGHLGVAGRQCDAGASGKPNSCNRICCGRGFETIQTETKEKCDCKFVWCCEVKCSFCHRKTLIHRCKSGPDEFEMSQNLLNASALNTWARNHAQSKAYMIRG